jgi:hypothetical protein
MHDAIHASQQDLPQGGAIDIYVRRKPMRRMLLGAYVLLIWNALLDRECRIDDSSKRQRLHGSRIEEPVKFRGERLMQRINTV